MMDSLLEWMSYRRAGRIRDIPACLADGRNLHYAASDLATLGHLELLPNASWKITPPSLAGLPRDSTTGATAILCGARTPGVLASLTVACDTFNAQLTNIPATGQASVFSVTAPTNNGLAAVALSARIPLQFDASFTLLACLPTIREWPRTPCSMVRGRVKTVRRFSKSRVGWVPSTLAEATAAQSGFFRIQRDWDWVSLLKTGVAECAFIDDRAGRLAVAAKLNALSWSADSMELTLPSELFPPVPIARALTLCTGALPRYDRASRRITFAGIPPEVLRLTKAITRLRLA